MKPEFQNDVDAARLRHDPDAHGQAALLIVESLMHGLIEKGLLSVDEAIDIMQSATEVKEDVVDLRVESLDTARHSLQLIDTIASSLAIDRPKAADLI